MAPDCGVFVTPAQIRERDRWELAHREGRCTLEELLMMSLYSGAPASGYLLDALERAFGGFSTGLGLEPGEERSRDLADAFGSARLGNVLQKAKARLYARDVLAAVELFNTEGHPEHAEDGPLPLSRSRDGKVTAFSVAARAFGISESQVIELYQKAKREG